MKLPQRIAGVAMATLRWLGAFFVILVLLLLLKPADSTDNGRWDRSGLRLHIDAATGCHYLSALFGGTTPRLDATGDHVCTGPE